MSAGIGWQELASISGVEFASTFGDPEISWVTSDSRRIQPGSLFVCMPSPNRDTHDFIEQAKHNGAVAVLAHSILGFEQAIKLELPAAYLDTFDTRTLDPYRFNRTVALLCERILGQPSHHLRLFGITGTNGKTSTAWMIRHALNALGDSAGYVGTLGALWNDSLIEIPNTTPFPVESWHLLFDARVQGMKSVVMEVSSHALAEDRLHRVLFDYATFTNLSQDHLDFHGTMEAYAAAKKLLFTNVLSVSRQNGKLPAAVINADDPYGGGWIPDITERCVTYGLQNQARDVALVQEQCGLAEIHFTFRHGGEDYPVHLPLGGKFQVENAMACIATLITAGYDPRAVAEAMSSVPPVPGRFEPVVGCSGIPAIVDYAHTPDALEKLLASMEGLVKGRVITVFGCGGDRDRTKRPLMARAASSNSDLVFATSDNPRTEDPERILDDVVAGIPDGKPYRRVVDRREAIDAAIAEAEAGDAVVVAGKGHEDYQIIGTVKHPMDDRELVRTAFARQGK